VPEFLISNTMKQIELEMPVDEMGEADLRVTLSDVLAAHEENVADYAQTVEALESAESDVEAAKTYFAQKAESLTQLSADVLVERFSLSELSDMATQADEAAEAFSEDSPEESPEAEAADEADEEPEGSLFAERPQKSPAFTSDDDAMAQYAEAARERLAHIPGLRLD
jgi:hypothetical protein